MDERIAKLLLSKQFDMMLEDNKKLKREIFDLIIERNNLQREVELLKLKLNEQG